VANYLGEKFSPPFFPDENLAFHQSGWTAGLRNAHYWTTPRTISWVTPRGWKDRSYTSAAWKLKQIDTNNHNALNTIKAIFFRQNEKACCYGTAKKYLLYCRNMPVRRNYSLKLTLRTVTFGTKSLTYQFETKPYLSKTLLYCRKPRGSRSQSRKRIHQDEYLATLRITMMNQEKELN